VASSVYASPGGSGPSGASRGIYVNTAVTSRFTVRDCSILATGAGGTPNSIGAESLSTSSFLALKHSSVSGGLADIKQPAYGAVGPTGCIQLVGTDLANNNAGGNGFLMGTNPHLISFSIPNMSAATTVYCVYGTGSTTPQSVPLNQTTTVVGCSLFYSGLVNSPGGLTLNLYNVSTGTVAGTTPFATISSANGNGLYTQFLNVSNTFTAGQLLQVKLVSGTSGSAFTAGGTAVVNIGTY
jgi:hypothetical protein